MQYTYILTQISVYHINLYIAQTRTNMRLNKYIAQSGITSRRKADNLIISGNVKINGKPVLTPGVEVIPGDSVEVNGKTIQLEKKKEYVLINKPKGYVTTVKDQYSRPTVMELVTDINTRLFPVGRLDYNTSGLILMTNDGDLAYKMTHPKHELIKTYRVKCTGLISAERIAKLRSGVDIGGYVTSKAYVKLIRTFGNSSLVEIKIHEGKNRQIRKMFSAVGNKVIDLERIAIGTIHIGHLKQGHYRKLKRDEINYLKSI